MARARDVDGRTSSSSRSERDPALMTMLKDLFKRVAMAIKRGKFGTLSTAIEGNVLEPAHYVLAHFPVVEVLEGLSVRIRSVIDAECCRLLTNAITELLVMALANDPEFPVEYVVQAEATRGDFNTHEDRAKALAEKFTSDFMRGSAEE